MKALWTGILGTVLLPSLIGTSAAAAEAPASCDMRLNIELTPDVPDVRSVGFLGSLLSNQVDYVLTLRRELSDSVIVVELRGPGPVYRCQNAVDAIRRDGRVLSAQVSRMPP
jgi:hypothetical protein